MLMGKPRRGLFGAQPQMPAMAAMPSGLRQPLPEQSPQQPMPAPEALAQPPGFGTRTFGAGWEDKAFALGGLLAGDGGQGIAMMRQEKQQQAAAIAAEQRALAERMAGREDYAWKRDYDRANPQASTPYRWESNDGSLMELGPDGQARIAYKDPTAKMNYQRVNNPDGTFTMVPVPIGAVAATPSRTYTDDDWNNAKPVGGAGGDVRASF